MKTEKRHIAIMIIAISGALLGLISLQIYLLMESYEQKQQAFDRNVLNVLNLVSQQLEKEEAASKIFTVAMEASSLGNGNKTKFKRLVKNGPSNRGEITNGNVSWIISDSAPMHPKKEMRVEVFQSSRVDTLTTLIIKGKEKQQNSNRQHSFGYSYSTDGNNVSVSANTNGSTISILQDTTKQRRREIVSRVVDKLFLIETLPIEQRLDLRKVDSLIKVSLLSVGISMEYSFQISVMNKETTAQTIVSNHGKMHRNNAPLQFDRGRSFTMNQEPKSRYDSIIVDGINVGGTTQHDNQNNPNSTSPFKARLFPNDVISPKYELLLFLPERSSFVLREMTSIMAMSLLFILIVIVSFIYTARVMILQRRFAGSIIDFINNMTHEFKTPIATIALASEAIAKPEVLKSRVKLRRYNAVIADENQRMKHQVDTILQLAVLERGEFDLKRSAVDLYDIITRAAVHASLQAEQRNGSVTTALHASEPVISGDPVHLANIIHNLLDNALKYSPAVPTIVVSTETTAAGIRITVKDNGIGIASQHLPRVFDKYYRVPTGNTHDVKGFGLGLSYVKLMVTAHGGAVSLSSTPGSGTTVTVELPR